MTGLCGMVKPCFDGEIQYRHGMYYISWAEIDRMGYSLNVVLQLIHGNISDGVISAYNLWPDGGFSEV